VLASLATLAYDGRRSALFRRELLEALQIIDEGHIRPQEMIGSWAGAMGQSQFMPSSFRQFAVDHDGDGRRDIWGSLPDVFASIANYLARSGWHTEEPWGQQVTLPSGLSAATTDLEVSRPLTEWQALGVRRVTGDALPAQPVAASLVLPDGPGGAAFLVQHNYRILLTWNRSHYFATTVGQFADQLQE
jgi:membrane-bound lytic murein transglycosylase B